jgi:hypothetical protein
MGRARQPVEWDAILRIFDTIWGRENRLLPKYPDAIKNMHGSWEDSQGVKYDAESLDEIGPAYQRHETAVISLRSFGQPLFRCHFTYWPSKAEAYFEVYASDQATADQGVAAVKQEFPLIAKYIFISYDTKEYDLALYIAKVLEARLVPGAEVFVAKRNILPGAPPLKVMLEDQLLHAEALVALCSKRSQTSPWLWWESSAVWARGHLVVPLFIDITPNEFGGPITLVCQGRSFFEVVDINSALCAVIDKVCPGHQYEELTVSEVDELNTLKEPSNPTGTA